jgi:hypothetical protein
MLNGLAEILCPRGPESFSIIFSDPNDSGLRDRDQGTGVRDRFSVVGGQLSVVRRSASREKDGGEVEILVWPSISALDRHSLIMGLLCAGSGK